MGPAYPLPLPVLAHRLQVARFRSDLVNHLGWFSGWDIDNQRALTVRMLHTWGEYRGPPLPRG